MNLRWRNSNASLSRSETDSLALLEIEMEDLFCLVDRKVTHISAAPVV